MASSTRLMPVLYPLRASKEALGSYTHLLCVHVRRDDLPAPLFEALQESTNEMIEEGATYPYEEAMDAQAFQQAFVAYDLMVGILVRPTHAYEPGAKVVLHEILPSEVDTPLHEVLTQCTWPAQLGGFYYVKPNYPGRSSHNCNAGFIVPTRLRGCGVGSILAQSYLYVGPALGYRASVFNLVYSTNKASLRLWETLGFECVGRIPQAGRMRVEDHEEYVDAIIIYKSFVEAT